jgi:hypothetical protein
LSEFPVPRLLYFLIGSSQQLWSHKYLSSNEQTEFGFYEQFDLVFHFALVRFTPSFTTRVHLDQVLKTDPLL